MVIATVEERGLASWYLLCYPFSRKKKEVLVGQCIARYLKT
jgi:hypothetical protein